MHVVSEETQPIAVPEQDFHRVRFPAAEGKQMTRERVLLEHGLHQDSEAVEALPHVGVTECQVDLHARRNDQHLVFSSCCAMYRRTAPGSLPGGANTRRPSASSTATAPGGIGRMCCRTTVSAPPSPLRWRASSAIRTAASVVGLPLPKPNWTGQRKIMLVAMLCRRQTAAALTPGCSASITIASLSASVKLRRFDRLSRAGAAVAASVKLFSASSSLAALLASLLIVARTLG